MKSHVYFCSKRPNPKLPSIIEKTSYKKYDVIHDPSQFKRIKVDPDDIKIVLFDELIIDTKYLNKFIESWSSNFRNRSICILPFLCNLFAIKYDYYLINTQQLIVPFNDFSRLKEKGYRKKLHNDIENTAKYNLTNRELDVLHCHSRGIEKTKSIAEELNVTTKTTSSYKVNLEKKFNANSVEQIVDLLALYTNFRWNTL